MIETIRILFTEWEVEESGILVQFVHLAQIIPRQLNSPNYSIEWKHAFRKSMINGIIQKAGVYDSI